jgi:hypothetical protein
MSKIIELGNKLDLSSIKRIDEPEKPDEGTTESAPKDAENDMLQELINQSQTPQPINYNLSLSPEETAKRRELIIKINRYRQRFANNCQEWSNVLLTEKPIHELENMLFDIRLTIQNHGVSNLGLLGYQQALDMIEGFAPVLNMNLQGLSSIAMQQETIRNCVDELCIEHTSSTLMPPHYRLAILTGGIMMNLNNINKEKQIYNNHANTETPEKLEITYKDL